MKCEIIGSLKTVEAVDVSITNEGLEYILRIGTTKFAEQQKNLALNESELTPTEPILVLNDTPLDDNDLVCSRLSTMDFETLKPYLIPQESSN